jgi:hypothetical protein
MLDKIENTAAASAVTAAIGDCGQYDSRLSDMRFIDAAAKSCAPHIVLEEVVSLIVNGWYGERLWIEGKTNGFREYRQIGWIHARAYESSWPSPAIAKDVWRRVLVAYIE